MRNRNKNRITDTPLIPEQVYKNLPPFLQECCQKFDDNKRERDIFLTASLGVISGLIRGVQGAYHKNVLSSNLYTVICAPPASGKGVLTFARLLAVPLHEHYQNVHNQGDESADEKKKKVVGLIIPADTSGSMLLQTLNNNGGHGILFETEADTLVNALKKEWGSYDYTLRGAFHHETVSYSRKGENSLIEIKRPKISLVLSGTPGQIKKLLPSTENGLFSRIIYYVYSDEARWNNVTPCYHCENLDSFFTRKGEALRDFIKSIENRQTDFKLKDSQWTILNQEFGQHLENLEVTHGDDARSTVARMGVIVFRIAMILSVLRYIGRPVPRSKIICEEIDFSVAMRLGGLYLEHAKVMIELTPASSHDEAKSRLDKFYSALPREFNRHEAIRIGRQMQISVRTSDRYLKAFLKKSTLIRSQNGVYKKP